MGDGSTLLPNGWRLGPVGKHLPLSTLPQTFTELNPNQQYYIHCKSGVRSMKALKFLKEQGFKYLKSVKGGISAWSDEIDHSVAKY